MRKNKICFIVCYFGELPLWFPAFLMSCNTNPSIDWLIFTDAPNLPSIKPNNVYFAKLSLNQFKVKAKETMKTDIQFSLAYKLCDFKPIYGDIFKDYLIRYTHWGHCDIDVIWGDITSFLNKIHYDSYDVISSKKLAISGHFTLYKNQKSVNELYKNVKNYRKVFIENKYSGFDEGFFSYYLYKQSLEPDFHFKIFWPDYYVVDRSELNCYPYNWRWKNGKIISRKGNERTYLHFMEWKYYMKHIDFSYKDFPKEFLITKYGIWSKEMGVINKIIYLFPNHLPRLIRSYIYRLIDKIKCDILKKERVPFIVPKGYDIIQ